MSKEFEVSNKLIVTMLYNRGNQRAFLIFYFVWVIVAGIYISNLFHGESCAPLNDGFGGSHVNFNCGVTGYVGYEQEQQAKILWRLAAIFVLPAVLPLMVLVPIYGWACVKSLTRWVSDGYRQS